MAAVGPPLDLDRLAEDWQQALGAARDALEASGHALPTDELLHRRRALGEEWRRTELLLDDVARVDRITPLPWLSSVPVTLRMLGLSTGTRACVFDLDGVLTDSGLAHSAAWSEVFDAFLLRHAQETGRQYIPFDRDADYRLFIDGRPRLEGIHAFLASRGIHLPEGSPDDLEAAETAWGLARRKGDALARVLTRRGVTALPGARRYLEAVGHGGLPRAVVSCSQSTHAMLTLAGLSSLVDASIDAATMREASLRSRPAPDVLIAACTRLRVEPAAAVTFTHTPEGVAAGRAAGLEVVGIGDAATCERLEGFGAHRVAPSLVAALEPRLARSTAR
jgi:beta-phosphoglucomutase-like phosphatase (HAD superfamily)